MTALLLLWPTGSGDGVRGRARPTPEALVGGGSWRLAAVCDRVVLRSDWSASGWSTPDDHPKSGMGLAVETGNGMGEDEETMSRMQRQLSG